MDFPTLTTRSVAFIQSLPRTASSIPGSDTASPPANEIRPDTFQASAATTGPRPASLAQSGSAAASHAAGSGGFLSGLPAAELHYADGRWNLGAIAQAAAKHEGLATEFPAEVQHQVDLLNAPAANDNDPGVRDLRPLKFSSIDNPTSQDLDQLEWAERESNGDIKVMVAVTDVDALVPKGSPADEFSKQNTTSIYAPGRDFPLLPEKLSNDLISLLGGQDRISMVTEMDVAPDGSIKHEDVYRGYVHNYAKLDYPSVGAWLDGKGPVPGAVAAAGPEMQEQIKIQNEAAHRLLAHRQQEGALTFSDSETDINVQDGSVVDVTAHQRNQATDLVENFMVSANGAMSRFLRSHGSPSIQRVVSPPEKWDSIRDVAKAHGTELPAQPDGKALAGFLNQERQAHPDQYADLSGSLIRLIGRGKFQALGPGEQPIGHFGLGVIDYAQQTASMRRRGDILNIRLAKDVLAGRPPSYTMAELTQEADNMTAKESLVKRAEREIDRTDVATLMEGHVGETFAAVVVGATNRGANARLSHPMVEGKLGNGKGLHDGEIIQAHVDAVSVEKGHIDLTTA